MYNISTLKNTLNQCTGCGICAVICPNKCIDLQLNSESFLIPFVNEHECTHCGLCVKVCYRVFDINNSTEGKGLENCKVYSAIHRDESELKSVSSGGVASELSKYCYKQNYNVIGAIMNPEDDYAKHIVANCEEDLEKMKSSKYVQSYIIDAFSKIDSNKKTLIIGLPCQIYGIRKYIYQVGIEKNFILVDLFCRGTTPINLFLKYKEYLKSEYGLGEFVKLNFRSKRIGWHKFSVVIQDKDGKEYSKTVYDDIFFSFYLKNTCFKESCYECEFRHNRVFADIRLGDFWGTKYYSHDEGVSLVSIYSEKGLEIWQKISKEFIFEENDPCELKKSQRFNKFPIPDYRKDLLRALVSQASLKDIYNRFEINEMSFYKEKDR
ncbi:Coenzyme F420 hydrogenase/dehydrogenase, beta subunit C-terminal domain [Proteiniborus sp. MB09-C3]|uniref:Coenzyme F420 hydrogenase/dehydrogenase, beta subunit C-terminal domain n=1 Tax=Proteiniborus sp. MB09-C3 TaxID=3050072 RepID=UPI0025556AFC|nr:Coenzyme F420 hydrogenase/dehydrogenase, beta subunit C-terminal domain [Proteiniborus sp. MB09-C3]WIV12037.1 Coenzyme F420 hydrogenase/dehydrogenase, beta subunit C-terminal domain [Proteiniborus sp. MB09-C3]